MMQGRSGLAVGLWLSAACIDPRAFPCEVDEHCGSGNVCEAAGFCSRRDEACASGRRYSPYAGSGLAGQCVGEDDSGTGTGTGTGADTGTGTGTGPDPVPAGELCGNNVLDEAEDCDDGNRENGDGCNAYCRDPGTPVWTVTYDDPQAHHEDRAFGVAIAPGGETFAITGFTTVDEAEGWDILVQLYDLGTGELLWTRSHGGDAQLDDTGEHVAFDPQGNLVVVGTVGTLANGFDIWIRKYDPEGSELWTLEIDQQQGDDKAQGVAVTAGGEIVVIGQVETDLDAGGHEDIWLARFNGSGSDVVEPFTLDGGGQDDQGIDVIVDADGNAFATGWLRQADGTQGVWTAKIDPTSNVVWSDTYVDPNWNGVDRGVGLALAPDGSLMVAGTVAADLWVRRYDPQGMPLETITHDGPEGAHDEAADVVFDADGSFFVVGFEDFRTVGFATSDIWVRRYSADGEPLWTDVVDGPAAEIDKALAVALDPHGAALVAGYITVPGQVRDAWIRLYAP